MQKPCTKLSPARFITLLCVASLLSPLLSLRVLAQAPDTLTTDHKVVEVRFTEIAPKIDGFIEDLWEAADSAYDFVQFAPYEKESPTERTAVYVLQDKENLYFAFRCHAEKHEPIASLTALEDDIEICIDPFGSKTTAYYFQVYASRIIDDGWIFDNGLRRDHSWDGVWYRAVKLYDNRWEVEIKVPFKSIRYKKGLDQWGIQFKRHIAANRETDYWTEVPQIEEDMVSEYGTLRRVEPHATGYYFELYPEGFVRYDKYRGEKETYKPRGTLNFKWDLTPQTTLNATAYPDFAQIESDPFELNLERYPVYLSERRPFFLEGTDIFRMSDFGQGKGFFRPLELFYSRSIGKLIEEEPIPILGGLKFTSKSENWNLGALGAYTDALVYAQNDTTEVTQPSRGFGVIRAKRGVLKNSDIGILFSGTMANRDDYNLALGLDTVYRTGVNQFILQAAMSDRNGKRGWAASYGYFGLVRGFLTLSSAEVVQDSFDVSDIGFVPWAGQKKFVFLSGPYKTYQKGFLRNLCYGPGIAAVQESDTKNWSTVGYFAVNPNFRNNWGFSLELLAGPYYEADTNYFYRNIDLSTWGSGSRYTMDFGGNYSYTYNYRRGFLAHRGSGWVTYGYTLLPPLKLSLSSNIWCEWDTLNTLIATTPRLTPRLHLRMGADMTLSVFNEFVMATPGTAFGKTEWISNRLALLFSWNFSPKSWLYIAVNDYREQSEAGGLELQNRIAAIKAKYLVYF